MQAPFSKLTPLLLLLSFAGCANMDKATVGTATGAVLGAAVGSQLGNNRAIGIAAGAAVGAFIGNRIGQHLNEQDKRRVAEASTRTAETGQVQQFKTAGGAMVSTAPVPIATAATPPQQTRTPQMVPAATTECRMVRQTIALQNGSRESQDVKLCNGADGWQPA